LAQFFGGQVKELDGYSAKQAFIGTAGFDLETTTAHMCDEPEVPRRWWSAARDKPEVART
jgi:DeoR/GlpR family transcriptional regulator of sugar metabolism